MPAIPFITAAETVFQFTDDNGDVFHEADVGDLQLLFEAAVRKSREASPGSRTALNGSGWAPIFAESLSLLFQRKVGTARAIFIADKVTKHFNELKKNFETLSTSQNSTVSIPEDSAGSKSPSSSETSPDLQPSENSAPAEPLPV